MLTADAWWQLAKCAILAYLSFSFILACYRIARYVSYEEMISKVPAGDVDYFKEPVLFDWLTVLLFPAFILIHLWMGFVKLINRLF